MSSSKRNTSGPAISILLFSGELVATLQSALATSSAAIGWKRTGGRQTVLPTGGLVGDPFGELEELSRLDDRVGIGPSLISFSCATFARR